MFSSLLTIKDHFRFEKLDITPKSAQKIKPVLERWMQEAEERYKNGIQNLTDFIGSEPSKKRKRRTSFTPQALEVLNNFFERNTHPSGKTTILCISLSLSLFLSLSLSLLRFLTTSRVTAHIWWNKRSISLGLCLSRSLCLSLWRSLTTLRGTDLLSFYLSLSLSLYLDMLKLGCAQTAENEIVTKK